MTGGKITAPINSPELKGKAAVEIGEYDPITSLEGGKEAPGEGSWGKAGSSLKLPTACFH